ncbi:MAG TPA: hypothetical protein VIL35_01355 [Vicinamibacterales bacterium]
MRRQTGLLGSTRRHTWQEETRPAWTADAFSGFATAGTVASLGDLGFLARLPTVSAREARLDRGTVALRPEIEPLVRLIEDRPRARVLEEVGARIRRGTPYRDVLAALLLAGVRNIQPRPVGFKFHAVLVVNSAHIASLASPDADRWLPIFWAIDLFKVSQDADVRAGDWTLDAVDEAAVPPAHKARKAFIDAMDRWDEPAADAAITGLVRTASPQAIFDLLARYGARDFREIGHKAIYVANSFRTLDAIGWQHAEPVLRSVAYALLDRDGAPDNPARNDYAADRPYRANVKAIARIRPGWLDGRPSPAATRELLQAFRDASPEEAGAQVIEQLNRGVAPASVFDACFQGAAELMMRTSGILSLHATTCTNAIHYAWQRCHDADTRRLLLLQNAAFLTMFRGSRRSGVDIDRLEPLRLRSEGPAAVEEIFGDVGRDHLAAARKILGWLQTHGDPAPLADAARRLIFLKGHDSHDYKYSSAVLEDYAAMSPPVRDRYLAAAAYYLKGTGDADNALVERIRNALA